MEKHDFVERLKLIDSTLNDLHRQRKLLMNEYIEHSPFKVADKVRVFWRGEAIGEAFVAGVHTHDDGEYFYSFRRIKTDGSMSNLRVPFMNWDRVELIHRENPEAGAAEKPPQIEEKGPSAPFYDGSMDNSLGDGSR